MAKSTKVTAAPVAAPAPVVPVTTAQAILATPPVQPIAKLHGGDQGWPQGRSQALGLQLGHHRP